MKTRPILMIHGGAGTKVTKGEKHDAYSESLRKILSLVSPLLFSGKSALEVVTRAAELLEDDPLYNAGKGSKVQRDGHIRMSASLMDGHRRRFSGCVNVERVKNPIRLAQALLDHEDRVLSEKGGEKFAREAGLQFASPFTAKAKKDYEDKKAGLTGTIGAVALDRRGRLAAATSTGGRGFEYPHRVSDSPTTAGNYANRFCAVSTTGVGEEIVDFALASSLCTRVQAGQSLEQGSKQILREARSANARFGFIAIDREGNHTALKTTATMIWAKATREGVEIFRPSR